MRRSLLALLAVSLLAPLTPDARAESWCAYPLWVHEWGVHVFGADGKPAAIEGIPSYFHTPDRASIPDQRKAVRDLPVDSGMRALPVLHFYSAGSMEATIPIGVEVGFTGGAASAWYPRVDGLRSATEANGPEARAERLRLLELRELRLAGARAADGTLPAVPADPTRQLVWDRLTLTPKPAAAPDKTAVPWVATARGLSALWVNAAAESERFVFYEAGTAEKVPLKLVRGETFGPGRRHYVLQNSGPHVVNDVLFVHREGTAVFAFYAPAIPPGKSAGFLVEDHRVKDAKAATRDVLRAALVDAAQPEVPAEVRWGRDDCVMGRDPALPVERAAGHKLFGSEVDLIFQVWGARFFDQEGTTIVYREDEAALDAAMPLSLYTDMFNYVVLSRAGLAVWEQVKLP